MCRCFKVHDMKFIGKLTSFRNALQQRNANMLRIGAGVFLLSSMTVHAGCLAPEQIVQTENDTISTFTKNILFQKGSADLSRSFAGNNARIDSIFSFLSKTDARNLLSVEIAGSYSPEGEYGFNTNLAVARAAALSVLVREFYPYVKPAVYVRHPIKGHDVNFQQLRAAELQIVYRNGVLAADSISGSATTYAMTASDDKASCSEVDKTEFCKYPPPQHFSSI